MHIKINDCKFPLLSTKTYYNLVLWQNPISSLLSSHKEYDFIVRVSAWDLFNHEMSWRKCWPGVSGCAVGLTHLPQGGQKMEVNGLSIAEDLQDTIQVYLVFTETPWRNQNSVYFLIKEAK